jgi:two-component system, LytTR family, response regulator
MPLKALIADDEPLARDELMYALRQVGGVDSIDQVGSALEAVTRLQDSQYDVLFLDIRMPGVSGLEAVGLVNRMADKPHVVFVTASDEHALEAFDLSATDYLVKPVSESRLRRTLDRVARRRSVTAAARSASDKLAVEGDGYTVLVRISDIRLVEARGHTVLVRNFDTAYRSRASLGELEEQLESHGFVRVHRAFMVNPDHVLEVHPFFAGTYTLKLDDRGRTEVPVSRAAARRLRKLFGL